MFRVSEWGGISSLPKPMRLPSSSAPTRPAMPELMCTTVPPAKSIAPHWKIRPAVGVDLVELGLRGGLGGAVSRGGKRLGGGVDRVRAGPVPDHVGDRAVDQQQPQRQEQRHGGELHALHQRADDQRGRDRREGHLEADVDQLGNVGADREGRGLRVRRHAGQERLGEAADERRRAAREGEAVADDGPQDGHDADRVEHPHQHREHVLGAHQAAVEQREARNGHQQHEHRGRQHPGGVALVDGRLGGRGRRGRGGAAISASATSNAMKQRQSAQAMPASSPASLKRDVVLNVMVETPVRDR